MKIRLLYLVPVLAMLVLIAVYAGSGKSEGSRDNSRYITSLRMIGHKLLLSTVDSISRVMPVNRLSEDEFQIRFENKLALAPDSIVTVINSVVKMTGLPTEYATRIFACSSNEIVYSYIMSDSASNTIVPCLGRILPEDCYYINMKFIHTDHNARGLNIMVAGSFLFLFTIALTTNFVFRRFQKPAVENPALTSHEKGIAIGRFNFYPSTRYLEIEGDKTELTDKESRILYILASSPNEVIDRDRLQKEVWEDDGVIVTRSLDVFISRLRKKLEKDSNLKLVNIHGKGYKLEVNHG